MILKKIKYNLHYDDVRGDFSAFCIFVESDFAVCSHVHKKHCTSSLGNIELQQRHRIIIVIIIIIIIKRSKWNWLVIMVLVYCINFFTAATRKWRGINGFTLAVHVSVRPFVFSFPDDNLT